MHLRNTDVTLINVDAGAHASVSYSIIGAPSAPQMKRGSTFILNASASEVSMLVIDMEHDCDLIIEVKSKISAGQGKTRSHLQ